MKATFKFRGERFTIEVPSHLYIINNLLEVIVKSQVPDTFDMDFNEAYDYLVVELVDIFAESKGLDSGDLYADFIMSEQEEDKKFGCIISVYPIEEDFDLK
jgi:hypothetical protein